MSAYHMCPMVPSEDKVQRGHLELELQVVGAAESVLGIKQASSASVFYHWANSPIIPPFWDRFLLYNSSWRGTHYVNHTDLKFRGLLSLLPGHWDEMHASPHLALIFFFHVHFAASVCASCSRRPEEDTWSSARVARPLNYQANFLAPNVLFLVIFFCFVLIL